MSIMVYEYVAAACVYNLNVEVVVSQALTNLLYEPQ